MKYSALWLPLSLALSAQDPAAQDRFREQLDRITLNPATDLSDSASRSREALRVPLHADPKLSLAELQAAQTTLIRLNDILNANAERAAQSGPSLNPPRQTIVRYDGARRPVTPSATPNSPPPSNSPAPATAQPGNASPPLLPRPQLPATFRPGSAVPSPGR